MLIFAIDPGNTESAYALIEMPYFQLWDFGKVENERLLESIPFHAGQADRFAIEMVASYGMPVGKDVFETCVWIGRFIQAAEKQHTPSRVRFWARLPRCGWRECCFER